MERQMNHNTIVRNDVTYEERIRQQIKQYSETINIHDLPEIFHFWSHNYIRPGLEDVFGTAIIPELYGQAYLEVRKKSVKPGKILSIGCGNGDVELDVATYLIDHGEHNFKIICADLSDILLERLRKNSYERDLSSVIEPVEIDLNKTGLPDEFDVIMANHSLHHIIELEQLFSYSYLHLKDDGIFATIDMIGRNGHMRWPETAAIVKAVWPLLHPEARYNVQLRQLNESFADHDCSDEGFEGVRAQDILPLLMKSFHPYRFHGVGGVIDLFVDRGYGPAYDIANPEHVAFIKFLADLNDILLDAGVIKPTMMFAHFTKDTRAEIFYRNRRAISSMRVKDPDWRQFY
jgi:SAM-dependent methyltransferase